MITTLMPVNDLVTHLVKLFLVDYFIFTQKMIVTVVQTGKFVL